MRVRHHLKLVILGSGAALCAMPAAAAGRCGGSLSIDTPTSLFEIARRCNVDLGALREANPGLDGGAAPGGWQVAIPDEIDDYAFSGAPRGSALNDAPAIDDGRQSAEGGAYAPSHLTDDHGLRRSDAAAPGLRVHGARTATRVRVRELRDASADPVWQREATGGGARSYAAGRMSYQQRSASRIHSAGVPTIEAPRIDVSSRLPAKAGAANLKPELISCSVLRKDDGGKIHKVRKIISTPTNMFVEIEPTLDGAYDCRLTTMPAATAPNSGDGAPLPHFGLPAGQSQDIVPTSYRLPDYNAIGSADVVAPRKLTLRGTVVSRDADCLFLRSESGALWGLAAAPGAENLLGKNLTAWGVPGVGGTCGGTQSMIVSHAVYAEQM